MRTLDAVQPRMSRLKLNALQQRMKANTGTNLSEFGGRGCWHERLTRARQPCGERANTAIGEDAENSKRKKTATQNKRFEAARTRSRNKFENNRGNASAVQQTGNAQRRSKIRCDEATGSIHSKVVVP